MTGQWENQPIRRVTVSGFGGQGKTALAREAGRWLVRTGLFRAAVFVDYAKMQALDAVSVAVGEIGGVLGETFIDAAAVTAALEKTPTLVILDNLEVLADEPLRALLTTAVVWSQVGSSRVLYTTRRPDFRHADYVDEYPCPHRRISLDGLGDKKHPDDAFEWFAAVSKVGSEPTVDRPVRKAGIELFDKVKFHPLSIRVLAQQQATMRQTGSDFAALAAALDRVLAGERDAEALCVDMDCDDSMIIEYILEALANPVALAQWMPQEEPE